MKSDNVADNKTHLSALRVHQNKRNKSLDATTSSYKNLKSTRNSVMPRSLLIITNFKLLVMKIVRFYVRTTTYQSYFAVGDSVGQLGNFSSTYFQGN